MYLSLASSFEDTEYVLHVYIDVVWGTTGLVITWEHLRVIRLTLNLHWFHNRFIQL